MNELSEIYLLRVIVGKRPVGVCPKLVNRVVFHSAKLMSENKKLKIRQAIQSLRLDKLNNFIHGCEFRYTCAGDR